MELSSQKQLRSHGVPPFCYLCGEPLDGVTPTNSDHCPPKGLFAPADRANFPIILPTHRTCNHQWHNADELIGIATDALHSRKKSADIAHTKKLDAEEAWFGVRSAIAVSNFPIMPMVARIVRGMHALIYKEFLPNNTKSKFHVPLPEADTTTRKIRVPLDQSFVFSGVIRKALLTNTADVVRAYNGKFKYACTWERFDDGTPFCIICFDIYGFHSLSPPVNDFPKAFVGMYIPRKQPTGAARASGVDLALTREDLLDPWSGI